MRQSHWCLYIPTHTSVCVCVVRCVCARASRQAKRKKCKFLLILTLYALCVYMSCKYIYIYMHICISIYMHINIIYTHIRIYTCIYIYVYIYIYAFLFNMLETVVWGQSKFFPIYFDSPNDLEICLSFFAISFYRMRRGYNRTRNPIDSVFIILSFTFYLFFFFLYRSLLCLSFDVSQYRIVLRQRSFSKYIRMQILSTNRSIFFFLLHSFSSLQISP